MVDALVSNTCELTLVPVRPRSWALLKPAIWRVFLFYISCILMKGIKEPLYRKYNKLARGFYTHSRGGNFRHERNTKGMKNFKGTHKSIRITRVGYDYTPLYKFLLSRVGQEWDKVYSEAVNRLDQKEPIFFLVDFNYKEGESGIVGFDESTYYSKLTVRNGLLVKADENAVPKKYCACCTHTFNGILY